MAAFDYSRAASTAQRLIARFGQTGALRAPGEVTGDPWNPTPGAPTDHPCTFAVLDYSNAEADGTVIRTTDKKVMLSTEGLAIEPTTAMGLIIGLAAHTILGVKPLSPAGTTVYFEIQARA